MAVSNNFSASTLDLNGQVSLSQPTALVWGPDGRLYVTESDGDVRVLSVAFGDKDPADADNTAQFHVTEATTLSLIKGAVQNHNDNGTENTGANRQVTGIDVTRQFDANGDPVLIDGRPAVTIYVTSSDNRIGAGGGGNDVNLDTNSGVITKMTQTGPDTWTAVDIVRGLPRSEENHATNGLEIIQETDPVTGKLLSERMIVASGGNANNGAPSNNFAGQQEQPLSAAILEIDLDMLKAMPVLDDDGRAYVYDIPTLNDPARPDVDAQDVNDPFGGNDGRNSAKLLADGPISIYSPGYRNAYDVEVSEDGRVWTYDNGANNSWGGRPIGEAGDNGGAIDFGQALGYIATNLNNGEGNSSDDINLVQWNPSNKDNFHEVTRSDDLNGGALSAGQGGAQTYEHDSLTYVYGGHPNPTRAEGSRAGLLFSPGAGTDDSFLLVSNEDSFGNGGGSDYDEVIAWLTEVENNNVAFPTDGIYGAGAGDLTKKVLAVTPGVLYDIYAFADGTGGVLEAGASPNLNPPPGGTFLGQAGLPSDIAEIVAYTNPVEGDYREAGKTDGALDSGNGSINGLTEYTSTILDDGAVKMSGAIIAAQLNGGNLIIMGRNADGTMSSGTSGGFAIAADRTTFQTGAAPLGLAAIGDDFIERGLTQPFQGSIWVASYGTTQPFIQILQPNNGAVPLAGSEIVNPVDRDLDGVDHVDDPFEFSITNGYAIAPGERIVIDFDPNNTNFPNTISSTGLLGAALDGVTPNRDAQTAAENFSPDQQFDGLYDIGGNILPGGNAPILQIKKVAAGTVVGAANTARDALHTGIRPSADTDRIVATVEAKNWILEKSGIVAAGQLTGMMFGDGTQANFLRFVFGSVNGEVGFEVGYEIGDANYQTLAQVVVPGLAAAGADTVELRFEINLDTFVVTAGYRLAGQSGFTDIGLGGFVLPEGVLRDVLTGDHTITDADGPALPSGAAIGVLAENAAGETLEAIDFNAITIEAFGNEILATDGAGVGQPGSANVDTVIYTGTDTALAPLDPTVENFDGRGSTADYAVTGNALDNEIRVGTGANVVTTGAGADVVRGTLAELAGDEITDFSTGDKVLIEGATLSNLDIAFGEGLAAVLLNGQSITFSGPGFENFQASDGPSTFVFGQTEDGVEIGLVQPETVLYRINAGSGGNSATNGSAGAGTITALDGGPDWIGDASLIGSTGPVSLTGAITNVYTQTLTDAQNEIEAGNVDLGIVPWQLFVNERSDNSNDATKLTYNFGVEAGKAYKITLYYTENWNGIFNYAGNNGGDTRQFDVTVEGLAFAEFTDINPMGETVDLIGGPLPTGAQTSLHQQYLGVVFERSLTYTATDGVLTLEFEHDIENPKVNAIQISALGGPVQPPADTTPPVIASISVENPLLVQDGPRTATVVLTDETGFDAGDFVGLTGAELVFSGIVPDAVSAPSVTLGDGGRTATLAYTLSAPGDAWPSGVGEIAIAAGAYGDAAGNDSAAAQAAFVLEPNLANLVRGTLVRAINVGTTDATPATDLGIDLVEGGTDNDRYGGAIASDSLITDATGAPIAFEADDAAYYTAPKTNAQLNANVDGESGTTGSNSGGVDLDGSAYHTYRDSGADTWTATYSGFANGAYVVELHFAELFQTAANTRVGDFHIQGQPVLDDFDVFAEAGGADRPISRAHNVTVTDGTITVTVDSSQGQAGYSAIAIYEAVPSDLPPTVSVGDVTVAEGADATLVFTRVGDLTEAVTVDYAVTPGSAGIDDYVAAATGQVTIPAGQGGVSLIIPTVDDDETEGAETFTVTITGVSAGAEIGAGSASVTISPSDPDALVSIAAPAEVVEGGDAAATDLAFTLNADDGLTGDLEITLAVDGVQSVGTVSFVNGAATFTVSVPQDSRWNGTESVTVAILAVGTAGYAPDPTAAAATGDVTEDDPADVFAGVAIGDFSDERLAPTDVGTLGLGESAITASQQGDGAPGGRDRDYITFTVAEGQALTHLYLDGYDSSETSPQAFMGLQAGPAVTVDPVTGAPDAAEGLLAGIVYGPAPGADLLPILAAGDPADAQGVDFPGFALPLAAGTYTLWLNQGGPSTTLSLRLVTEALATTVTISDAAPVLEADGALLEFVLTASDDSLDGQTVTITYDTADATGLTRDVLFTGTTGTLTIGVINDEVADGDDTVVVTLTGAGGGVLVDATPANGTVIEDDGIDPADIDGDGIPNAADPFAYDGANGGGKMLTAGGSFRQDFDVATADPFSAEAGFSGILVNPAFNPPGASQSDPYGDRTTEATTLIENGVLKIQSSETDLYATGTGASNTQKDSYHSAADVSGVDSFSVEGRIQNGFLGTIPLQYASFGITLGAGGTDDYVKFVLGGSGTTPRIQLSQENSLAGSKDQNIVLANQTPPVIEEDIASVVFRLDVDKSGAVATLTGTAILYGADGAEIATIATATREITGSLAASLEGANPLTGGTGGVAYGVSITDWSNGDGNRFTGEWDYLEIFNSGSPVNLAPTADPIVAPTVDENAAPVSIDLLADANAADGDGGTLAVDPASVTVQDQDGDPVSFTLDGTGLSIDPAQFAALNAGESATVTVGYDILDGQGGVTPNTATLTVEGVDDAVVPTVSITGTPSAAESGDGGTQTTLVFDLSGTPDATVDLTYSVGGVAQAPVQVTFDATGVATLPVDVANDDLANGEDSVQVALVSTSTPGFAVDATVATGTITEDDFAPVAVADTPSTPQNTPITFDPAANDTDADLAAGETLTVTAIDTAAATGGTVILNGDGTVTVTPEAGFTGEIAFGYTVTDSAGNQDAAGSASVTISPSDPDALVSIAAPAEVVEGGDAAATDLAFTLNADDGLTGDLEITLAVDGVQSVGTVSFVNGAATFTVSVPQDSRWNGTESVTVAILAVGTAGYAPDPTAAAATGDVTEDDPADVFAGVAIGDFSDERLAPTDVGTLGLGESAITASQQGDGAPGGRDRDYITFTVAEGQALTHLYLDGYDSSETSPQAFMGLQAGPAVTVDPVTGAPDAAEGLLAGIVYGPAPGADLLPILAAGDPADAQGVDFPGFALPLAAGTYTLWLNQGGPSTTLSLRLVTEALATTVTISDAAPVLEADGALLEFVLTASDDSLDGQTVTITYDTADATGLTRDVLFTGTTGTLTIGVINDEVADGDDTVVVTLTGAGGGVLVDATPANGTVIEDDGIDPADIDGDGIPNAADPFAYDGANGGGKMLTAGGSFRQDFDVATADPFSAEAGFSGILVNPAFNPPGASQSDPYGDRTTEATTLIENGVLKIQSSETDLYATGTGASNTQKDSYHSAADVSGVDSFSVEGRIQNGFLGTIPLQYASFGITLGAGGTDDYVKFVLGGSGTTPRIQLSQENSLAGSKDQNIVLANQTPPVIEEDIASVVFRLDVDKSGAVATLTGTAILYGADGAEIATIATATREITGSLAASLEGANPLTGGTGGVAYGVSITDWSNGDGNRFTGEWDYLEIFNSGSPVNLAPTADPIVAPTVDENAAPVSIDLLADANAADGDGGTLAVDPASVTVQDQDGDPVSFTLDGTGLSIDPAQFAALNAGESATVTVGYDILDGQGGVTPNTATLTVEGVDDAVVPTVSITGTPSAAESGDGGTQTTLVFDLSGTPDATVDLTYSVGGVAQAPVQVTFDATGVATLPVDVANDDLANGEDSVQVALVSTSTPGFAVDATVATGTITEDDFAPVAVADTPSTPQNTPITFDPAANDTDADLAAGETLTVTAIDTAAATGGTVILNGDGTVTVTPEAGFTGDIVFGYTVADSAGNQDTIGSASVTVTDGVDTRPTVRIEAETGTLSGGFSVESGRIRTTSSGEATYDLSGIAGGDYLVRIGYWDENDGASSVGVTMSSASAGTFSDTLLLDEATPSGTFTSQNYRETTLDGAFKLGANGLLTLTGLAQGSEIVRIDWIELIPTGAPADNAAPSVSLANVIAGIPEDADTAVRIKVADIVVTDDGQGVNMLGLAGADAALFEIDGTGLFLKAGMALDATANPSLDVTVTVDDATIGGSPDGTALLSLPVTEAGGAPSVSVGVGSSTTEGDPAAATLTLSGASDQPITVTLVLSSGLRSDPATIGAAADGGDLAFDATGLAALDVTIPAGALSVDVPFSIFQDDLDEADFETFEIAITAANVGASIDGAAEQVAFAPAPAEGGVLDDDAPVTTDVLAPDGDLDGDGALNAVDPDVDGDGIANSDDSFAYDAGNGMTLAAGETRTFDFDVDGTIYQNGMTGFLQGTANGGAFDEDTGAATVSGGFLTVDPVTAGDTGSANNPQDDPQVGVKNGSFTARVLVVNPWAGAAPNPNSFDQLGLVLGLDSDDMIKLVFGQSAGVVEFQKQETTGTTTTATKYGGSGPNANVPLPAGVTLDTFAKAEIVLEVVSTGPTSATVTGSVNFLDAAGAVIATGLYGTAPIGGALAAALADPAIGVGVGFTHVDGGGDPGFIAQLDSLSIAAAGAPAEDLDPPTAAITLTNPVDADSPLLVSVALDDASGIDTGTLGADDLALAVSGIPAILPVTFDGFADGVASYSIAAPAGGWTDGVPVTVSLKAGEVADLATTPNTNAAASQALTLAIGGPPADPADAIEAFAAQDDLDIGQTYGADVNGAAVLRIMKGVDSVASSNFGSNSFQVENTGDKKISAIFIDVSSALYPDSVFDPDGLGGDAAFKSWAVNTDGIGTSATGAYVSGTGYFLPGVDPIPNSGGSGGSSNGGYKGAMVKFDASSSGGFQNGEIVGFSGDMDPNSIAGMAKSNSLGVDTGAIQNWDVGGISGHELIGSLFTVLFDDGTTASGQLAGDKSNAGSVAIASQNLNPSAVTLTVNGVGPGATGLYGGVTPSVIVTGDPGDLVRITLSKGLNPVTNDTNGIADLVRERLDRYDFKVNNAFDEQSVDVVIGSDGAFDASDLFDYGDAIGTGKGGFTGDDVAPIAFVASVIAPIGGGEFAPAGPVTAPIYLANQGGPVTGDPVDPPNDGTDPAAPVITGVVNTATVGNGETFAFDVDATDANPGDTLSYGISGGADAGLFGIDVDTGVVGFKDPASFTPGGDNVYDLEVTVSDPGGLTDTRAYAVTVIDDVPPTTLTVPIAASADDWEQRGGAGSLDLEFGLNGTPQTVGLRFDGVTIPDGAVLEEAFIRFTALETSSGTANLIVGIENTENAAGYTSANAPHNRATVDDFVWNPEAWTAGQSYELDVEGLVSGVIGSDGIEDGALSFIFRPGADPGSRIAEPFDGDGQEPELVLIFQDDTFLG